MDISRLEHYEILNSAHIVIADAKSLEEAFLIAIEQAQVSDDFILVHNRTQHSWYIIEGIK